MGSLKLNNWQRSLICKALLTRRFGAEEEALKQREHSLAEAVYNDVFSEHTRARLLDVTKGWLPTIESVSVEFGGRYIMLSLAEPRPVPYERYRHTLACYEATHHLSEEFSAFDNFKEDLKERRDKASVATMAALDSCSTLSKLLTVWPEVRPYLPESLQARQPPKLPALNINTLNEMLKLELVACE